MPSSSFSSIDALNPSDQTQKWVLKVPVDCEGCRKKVTKILHTITGVESCDVDIKQQKVVVTGNVDVGTLLKTLVKKTGKHAEIWPEKVQKTKKKGKEKLVKDEVEENRAEEHRVSNSEEKDTNMNGEVETGEEEEGEESPKVVESMNAPPPSAAEVVVEKKVRFENKKKGKGQNGNREDKHRVESPPVEDNLPPPINNVPPRHQKPTTFVKVNSQSSSAQVMPPPNHIPPPQHYVTTSTQVNGQPSLAEVNLPHQNHIPPRHPVQAMSANVNGQPSSTQAIPAANHIPTRHPHLYMSANNTSTAASAGYGSSRFYQHPQPESQPVYTVSYSTAPQAQASRVEVQNPRNPIPPSHPVPRSSYHYPQPQQPVYTTSYNVAPQPRTSTYGYQGSSGYSPPPYRLYDDEVDYDAYGYRHQPQPESFGMFSDENPNACLIM